MKIIEIKENKKQFLPLMLLADEQENMIDRYIDKGTMFVLDDNGIKSECIVTNEGDGILEIKNIATYPEYQGKGYAKKLIEYVAEKYKDRYSVLQVGTGNSPLTVPFYEKCGFVRSHIIPDFFTDNYNHPIFECGVQLVDMVYLRKSIKRGATMSKKLTAYFSASGVTAKVAKALSEAVGTDLFEIKPAVPYTDADLDWQNKNSRSSLEMSNLSFRPEIAEKLADMDEYGTIFVGFPIWWYIAPTIINTFLESYDFSGKKIVLFATSGGSGFGRTAEKLADSCKGAELITGKLLNGRINKDELAKWASEF